MKKTLIYLATPYTYVPPKHRGKEWPLTFLFHTLWDKIIGRIIMWRRFETVNRMASLLFRAGYFVFSPISHTRPIAKYGLPSNFPFYEEYDTRMLKACDELWVLTTPGFETSYGVNEEIRIAHEEGIPVKFLNPDTLLLHSRRL